MFALVDAFGVFQNFIPIEVSASGIVYRVFFSDFGVEVPFS